MPRKSKLTPKQKELSTWELRVDTMDVFEMPSDYEASKHTKAYKRFTGYVKEWLTRTLTGKENDNDFDSLEYDRGDVPKNWWDIAMKVGSGKKVVNTIPEIDDAGALDKQTVYNKLLPVYRALKESFDKRPFYHWLTQHSCYTAERDTINALSGLMQSLTGDTQEGIDNALAIYRKDVVSSGVSNEARKENAKNYREEREYEIKRAKYKAWDEAEKKEKEEKERKRLAKERQKNGEDWDEILEQENENNSVHFEEEEFRYAIAIDDLDGRDLNTAIQMKKPGEDDSLSESEFDKSFEFQRHINRI